MFGRTRSVNGRLPPDAANRAWEREQTERESIDARDTKDKRRALRVRRVYVAVLTVVLAGDRIFLAHGSINRREEISCSFSFSFFLIITFGFQRNS